MIEGLAVVLAVVGVLSGAGDLARAGVPRGPGGVPAGGGAVPGRGPADLEEVGARG